MSALSPSVSLMASTCAKNNSPVSSTVSARARRTPSTSTFTVPSGSFNTCNTWATVPISCKSFALGSSSLGLRCASKNTGSSLSIAKSSAAIDLGRPTNKGSTMCGYTTTSRSGKVASALYSSKCLSVFIFNPCFPVFNRVMRKVVPEYVFSRLAPHSSAESIHSASSAKLQLHFAAVPTAVFWHRRLEKTQRGGIYGFSQRIALK